MMRKQAVLIGTFCTVFALGSASAAPSGETGAMDSAGDRPGEWKLDFKNANAGQFHSVQFVRVLRQRDARGLVKYDVILMTDDHRYPFGLWDTYIGKCDSHAAADIWAGELNTDGDAKGAPVAKIEYVPQGKRANGSDTLQEICDGATTDSVADPIAYAHDFLKR